MTDYIGDAYVYDGTAPTGNVQSTAVPFDHGALSGLSDDDHLHYHTDIRGDARYSQLAHTHAIIPLTIPIRAAYATQVWTSMPLALTEFNGNTQGRIRCDLTLATQARLVVKMMSTPGVSGAELRMQYSTDETNWFYLDNVSGPAAAITVANVTTAGAWASLVAGAKADVFLRAVGVGGDGAASPSFGNISIQVR